MHNKLYIVVNIVLITLCSSLSENCYVGEWNPKLVLGAAGRGNTLVHQRGDKESKLGDQDQVMDEKHSWLFALPENYILNFELRPTNTRSSTTSVINFLVL